MLAKSAYPVKCSVAFLLKADAVSSSALNSMTFSRLLPFITNMQCVKQDAKVYCIYTVNQKHTKMFLSYDPQMSVDSDKIWYTLS